jgi:hypothetical protein
VEAPQTPLNKPDGEMRSGNDEVTTVQKVWLQRIKREEKSHENFRDRSLDVEQIYNSDLPDDDLYVPLYWSVVGVEHVGVYSNQPVPDVRPRNEADNPLFRGVAKAIQRGLNYCVDHPSFDDAMHRSIDDFLAMALGVPRIKIDSIVNEETSRSPIFATQQTPMGPQQIQVGEREETVETVGDQAIRWEYVPWRRFGWEPCNDWKHCNWIYFRHRMTMLQIKKRFGKTIKASKDERDRHDINSWKQRTFDIYEVWDKTKKEVVFIAKGESEPVEVNPDPLGLMDFFPTPRPMMTNVCSEELIPKPDYNYIEAYDRELNRLQERRMSLLEQIKAAGAFDQGITELGDLLELEDGQMKPIQGMMQRFNAAGGPDNALWFLPIQEKVQALQVISEQIQMVKAQVDEILGISDIVRGVTAASETATAQEIKGRWVGVRLTRKRETVIYTVKSMMNMMAQLLASHITPENLKRMTQMPLSDEMIQLMRDDMMMDFIIDIETDSTVAKDENKERETFQEMLNGTAQWAQSVLPMVQQNQMPAGAASAILTAALRPYTKYDRTLEEELAKLPQTQQQLQSLNQQIAQQGQQLQEAQIQAQQWQQMATLLQQAATEAKAAKEMAESKLKAAQEEKVRAETREIYGETKDGALQPVKTAAEIHELRERADNYEQMRGSGE